ncbi:MAG: transcription antitermination factor NusB, partial [Pseudomonadota bacterium]
MKAGGDAPPRRHRARGPGKAPPDPQPAPPPQGAPKETDMEREGPASGAANTTARRSNGPSRAQSKSAGDAAQASVPEPPRTGQRKGRAPSNPVDTVRAGNSKPAQTHRGSDTEVSVGAAGLAPREGALELIAGVLNRGRPLSEMIETPFHRGLAPADRAASHRLATSVLRQRACLDAVLERFVAKPPPAAALHVLRLAAAELLIDGAAPHGVVNAAVS